MEVESCPMVAMRSWRINSCARLADGFAHALERLGQPSQFILAPHVDLVIVILLGDFGRRAVQLRHRLHDLARHQVSSQQGGHQRQQP